MRGRQGMALILILWVVTLVGLLVLWTGREVRTVVGGAQGFSLAARDYLLAYSGLQEALVRLTLSDPEARWVPDGTRKTLRIDGRRLEVSVEPEHLRLNVNRAKEDALAGVLEEVGLAVDEVAQAILDFKDRDNVPRPQGAEEEYYQGLTPPYRPVNRPFQVLEELLYVKGIDRDVLYRRQPPRLLDLVTLWGGRTVQPQEGEAEEEEPELKPGRSYRITVSTGRLTVMAVVVYLPHTEGVFKVRYRCEFYPR